ncbi:DHA2 family efflux MFS transporter permease subunit [Staphylococcus devriesei]|uniref:MDR family MFS transporter n=1 Tax=Staphylococcus devriesei TaxID=586733 RepID=UPI000E6A202D|nr:MDR family MFS transporter [Staphylococcus devriesei]RIL72130.1 DHA2 family efflux MFS transporter permease subunit [Staphylococcus devriesei]
MSNIEVSTKKQNLIVAVMLLSAFIAILNQTLLNTALPHIMKELKTSESTAQWLVTGFMLVNGTMIPLTAYLMDKIKTKPLYLISMGIFLLGSVVAAIAPNFGVLMLARVIQAIGAGIIMPLMQFTLFTLFSKEKRGFAMGLAGLVIQFAPAIGPTFSGLIIDNTSWRVPFIIIVGIALIGYIFGAIFLSSYNETKDTQLDKRSVIYSTLGFGIILYAFSSAGNLGFTNPIIIISFIVGIVIVGVFVKRQLNIPNPLLNLRVFKSKIFTFSTITSMIVMMSMVGPALLIPLFVQNSLGLSAFLSGMVIMPGAILNGIMSVYTGKIYDKYGPRLLILTGFTILIITTIFLCFLKYDSSYMLLVIIYAIRMFAVSLLMMPINTAGINALRNEDISHGTAIMNFGHVMAGSLGTALMVTFMSIGAKLLTTSSSASTNSGVLQRQSVAAGVDLSFAIVTVFVIIGFIFSLFIKEERHYSKQ